MPFIISDGFYDGAGRRLPDCSVAYLNRGGDWSARKSTSGLLPKWTLDWFGDVETAVPPLVDAGVAGWDADGGLQILPGCGASVVNACDLAVIDAERMQAEMPAGAPARPLAVVRPVPAAGPPAGRPGAAGSLRTFLYRNPSLKAALRDRDGDLCRFCSVQVRWGKGRAADSGTWELLDQGGSAEAENIVVACMGCSGTRRRTPGEFSTTVTGTVTGAGTVTGTVSAGQNRHRNRHEKRSASDQNLDFDLNQSQQVTEPDTRVSCDGSGTVTGTVTGARNRFSGGDGSGQVGGQAAGTPGDLPDADPEIRYDTIAAELAARAKRPVDSLDARFVAALIFRRHASAVKAAAKSGKGAKVIKPVGDKTAYVIGSIRLAPDAEQLINAAIPSRAQICAAAAAPAKAAGAHKYVPHPSGKVDQCVHPACSGLPKKNRRHVVEEEAALA